MKVNKNTSVFNLFNTNGRRKDTINAYKTYLNILKQVYEEGESAKWGSYPSEFAQFRFYELAIESSPEIFKDHPKYDSFIEALADPDTKYEFVNGNIDYLKANELYHDLDANIEQRARHYSSNLVKIGFTNQKREISPVGKAWMNGDKLKRSRLEALLPIDDTNLMFLRQLLKLRVYTRDGKKYYSPFMMAIFILLKSTRVAYHSFMTLVQMLNPYLPVEPSAFVDKFLSSESKDLELNYVPYKLDEKFEKVCNESVPMSEEVFKAVFTNRKNKGAVKVYRQFYDYLVEFNDNRTERALRRIVKLLSDKRRRNMINKAFGFGADVFNFDNYDEVNVIKFMNHNESSTFLQNDNLNEKLFLQFMTSKRHDQIQEYGDVTRRVMKVTGIISFKNGIVELALRDLWQKLFNKIHIEDLIFGESTNDAYAEYEKKLKSPFLNHRTIEQILEYKEEDVEKTITEIIEEMNLSTEEDIRQLLFTRTKEAFTRHINENYSKDKILEILPLFSDRSNDLKIQEMVAENTDVPTIFEYIVGIAWYHLSSQEFDLFNSLNLSMSADFEPETHAGGGAGDIIIDYGNHILMIEVTLMNKYAQKRGEWEPVLRHATNLTIESAPKKVTTLFIADELDINTINIWRAIATVPLKSSRTEGFAKTVTIMPLKNEEFTKLLEKGIDEFAILRAIQDSFDQLSSNFNMKWRDEILDGIS